MKIVSFIAWDLPSVAHDDVEDFVTTLAEQYKSGDPYQYLDDLHKKSSCLSKIEFEYPAIDVNLSYVIGGRTFEILFQKQTDLHSDYYNSWSFIQNEDGKFEKIKWAAV